MSETGCVFKSHFAGLAGKWKVQLGWVAIIYAGQEEGTNMQRSLMNIRYLRILWHSIRETTDRDLALVSAGVAFFLMLSLFPGLAALITLLSLVSDPAVVLAEMEEMRELLPNDVYDIIRTQIEALVTASGGTLGWAGVVSVVLALWSARAGVGAMMVGLNRVYGVEKRTTFWHYLRAFWLTILLIFVGIVALMTLVIVPIVLAFFPLGVMGTIAIEMSRWLIALIVLFAGIGALYRHGPNRQSTRIAWLSPGAIFAVLAWVALSWGFSYYVANFGNYNQVYGSIGAVIAMLIWLWISSFLVLFGAALNVQWMRD